MTRGRKPVPTVLHFLNGNPGKRRRNEEEPQPRTVAIEPPADLKGDALTEWQTRGRELTTLGLLTILDVPAFITYCRAWARYLDAERKLVEKGELIRSPNGYPIQNPYRIVSNQAWKQCLHAWAEFGMTPASRSRVRSAVSSSRPALSKLDRFIKRVK